MQLGSPLANFSDFLLTVSANVLRLVFYFCALTMIHMNFNAYILHFIMSDLPHTMDGSEGIAPRKKLVKQAVQAKINAYFGAAPLPEDSTTQAPSSAAAPQLTLKEEAEAEQKFRK